VRKLIAGIIILFFIFSLAMIAVPGCGVDESCEVDEDMNKSGELEPVEIREYEGAKLGSVDDFRENSIKGPQRVDIESYQLNITGLVENPKNYDYDEVINNYQQYKKVVTLDCVEGWSVVLVRDLIEEANLLPEAKTVIFHAYDGYTTSLPLDYIMDNDIIMAYKMNDIILPPERGFPFQLVAESKRFPLSAGSGKQMGL